MNLYKPSKGFLQLILFRAGYLMHFIHVTHVFVKLTIWW